MPICGVCDFELRRKNYVAARFDLPLFLPSHSCLCPLPTLLAQLQHRLQKKSIDNVSSRRSLQGTIRGHVARKGRFLEGAAREQPGLLAVPDADATPADHLRPVRPRADSSHDDVHLAAAGARFDDGADDED